jgi:integrase
MKGSFVSRNGHYYAVLEDKDAAGKRKQKWITLKSTTYQKAIKEFAATVAAKNNGTFVEPQKMPLSEYLKQWLDDCVKPNLAPRTYQLYSYMSNLHINPSIGSVPISDLKPQHLQKLYSKKIESGLSPRTVQLIHVTLHKSLDNAVKTGLLVRNVAELVDVPKAQRPEMHIMNEKDLNVFLALIAKSEYYPLFYCYVFTGVRRSELLAVKWADVDLLGMLLSISHKTKTQTSRRMIDLSPSTCIVLREHRDSEDKIRASLKLEKTKDNDFVFSHLDGSPFLPNTITHVWLKLSRRCGLKGFRLHDIRHSHASILLKDGVNIKVIQERLGHANISTTLNIYAHVMPGQQKIAAAKFDKMLLPQDVPLDKC